MSVSYMTHPLIRHKITLLRKEDTSTNEFRKLVEEIAMLMGQFFSSSFGLGSTVQVVFNTSFAVVEYFEYRLVAEMAKNSTENDKVDDLHQQGTIQVYQFVPSLA